MPQRGYLYSLNKIVIRINPSGRKSQYETRFDKWKFKKNQSQEEWNIICGRIKKRRIDGKSTHVYLNNKLVSARKIRKAQRRCEKSVNTQYHEGRDSALQFDITISENPQDYPPHTPPGFRLLTPPPERNPTPTPRGERLRDSFPGQGVTVENNIFSRDRVGSPQSMCQCGKEVPQRASCFSLWHPLIYFY